MKTLLTVLALLIVTGCGSDDSSKGDGSAQSLTAPELQEGGTQVGPQGPKGEPGGAGRDGRDGKDGAPGAAGKDGRTVNGTSWLDPVTDTYWTIGSKMVKGLSVCQSGWRQPTVEELRIAIARGLHLAVTALDATADRYWIAPDGPLDFYQYSGDGPGASLPADKYTYLCIEAGV